MIWWESGQHRSYLLATGFPRWRFVSAVSSHTRDSDSGFSFSLQHLIFSTWSHPGSLVLFHHGTSLRVFLSGRRSKPFGGRAEKVEFVHLTDLPVPLGGKKEPIRYFVTLLGSVSSHVCSAGQLCVMTHWFYSDRLTLVSYHWSERTSLHI